MVEQNPHLEILMNEAMRVARELLETHGEFHTFGIFVDPEGKVDSIARAEQLEVAIPEDIPRLLIERFRSRVQRGGCQAIAMVRHVRVTPPGESETDAVEIGFEDQQETSVDLYLPYARQEGGEVRFGHLFAGPRRSQVFTATVSE